MRQKVSFYKWGFIGLTSEFSFNKTGCHTRAEKSSPIAGGRTVEFIPFPRVLALYEMQTVSSRIWTLFAVSIFYNGNPYTIGASSAFECASEEEDEKKNTKVLAFSWKWC